MNSEALRLLDVMSEAARCDLWITYNTAQSQLRALLTSGEEEDAETIDGIPVGEFQDWAGMDGAIVWHLIARYADGWPQVGAMMNAWLAANIDRARLAGKEKADG